MTLRAGRLTLVPLDDSDVAALFEIARNPASIEDFQHAASTPDDVRVWVDASLASDEVAWTIRDGDDVVGFVCLEPTDDGDFEVGYFVDIGRAGRGIATSAVAATIDWAFASTACNRIEAGITAGNDASMRVVEKANFEHIRTIPDDWEWNGEVFDSEIYEVTRDRWSAAATDRRRR